MIIGSYSRARAKCFVIYTTTSFRSTVESRDVNSNSLSSLSARFHHSSFGQLRGFRQEICSPIKHSGRVLYRVNFRSKIVRIGIGIDLFCMPPYQIIGRDIGRFRSDISAVELSWTIFRLVFRSKSNTVLTKGGSTQGFSRLSLGRNVAINGVDFNPNFAVRIFIG